MWQMVQGAKRKSIVAHDTRNRGDGNSQYKEKEKSERQQRRRNEITT
jgi:hypothetical protein